MVQIQAEVLDQRLKQEAGRPGHQHEQHQQDRQGQVQLGQAAHPLADAAHHRGGRRRHDHDDQPDLDPGGVWNAQQIGQAAVHLRHAEAQRGGDAEGRAPDGEDVDGVADRAVDPLAQQRRQARPQGQRQTLSVREIGQAQPHQRIDGPGVRAIVEEGDPHRLARGGEGAAFAGGRIDIVLDGLGDPEIHQADPHAGGEQHGQPGQVGEVGLGVVRSQFQSARRPDGQHQHQSHEPRHRGDIEPAEGVDHPGLDAMEHPVGLAGREGGDNQQHRDDGARAPEDARVHFRSQHRVKAYGEADGSPAWPQPRHGDEKDVTEGCGRRLIRA